MMTETQAAATAAAQEQFTAVASHGGGKVVITIFRQPTDSREEWGERCLMAQRDAQIRAIGLVATWEKATPKREPQPIYANPDLWNLSTTVEAR